jgi:hypothetical protein
LILERSALAAALRVSGVVFALGYLLGFLDGPIVAVAGGIALVVLGRLLLTEGREVLLGSVALAVFAGALGVAALRWNTLEIGTLRGAQAVLGPTLLVGPESLATAAWLAAVGGLVALGVAATVSGVPDNRALAAAIAEGAVGALAIGTVSWGPALSEGLDATGIAGWALVVVVALIPVVLIAAAARFRPRWMGARVRWGLTLLAGALVLAGGVLAAMGP